MEDAWLTNTQNVYHGSCFKAVLRQEYKRINTITSFEQHGGASPDVKKYMGTTPYRSRNASNWDIPHIVLSTAWNKLVARTCRARHISIANQTGLSMTLVGSLWRTRSIQLIGKMTITKRGKLASHQTITACVYWFSHNHWYKVRRHGNSKARAPGN